MFCHRPVNMTIAKARCFRDDLSIHRWKRRRLQGSQFLVVHCISGDSKQVILLGNASHVSAKRARRLGGPSGHPWFDQPGKSGH